MTDASWQNASPISGQQARCWIKRLQGRCYVYLLCYPNGRPFYVGKGSGNRVFMHERDAKNLPSHRSHKLNTIRAIWKRGETVRYELDGPFETEGHAHSRERELIRSIGRHDEGCGPLTNQTDGGEGTLNPSETSLERRGATLSGNSDDPDRHAANEFFHSLNKDCKSASVPIKPLSQQRLVALTLGQRPYGPTVRSAQALLAAAVSGQILLAAGCQIPRVFEVGQIEVAIENGAGRAILKSGLATLVSHAASPEEEIFVLMDSGFRYIKNTFGTDRLLALGVIEPEI
ncbi:MAG: GIY-YIG nuclease family protein [Bradyrhizobium sp.]